MSARPAWVGLGLPEEASAPAFRSDGGSSDGVNDHLRRELAARGGESTTLRLGSEAAASVDAYIEYRRIVGDADGGVLFSGALLFGALYASAKCLACGAFSPRGAVQSEALSARIYRAPRCVLLFCSTLLTCCHSSDEEYARFRAAALSERSANRLYVAWRSVAGIDCKVSCRCCAYAPPLVNATAAGEPLLPQPLGYRHALTRARVQNVGPATACECGHRYRDHATDSLSGQRHPKVRLATHALGVKHCGNAR
jgi:hypothetical protein